MVDLFTFSDTMFEVSPSLRTQFYRQTNIKTPVCMSKRIVKLGLPEGEERERRLWEYLGQGLKYGK